MQNKSVRPPPKVASLKFHLTADAWEYPDWALFESFSPTTGDDLQLVESAIRAQLEQVQQVEFARSPDGPYQYLCLRHNPYTRCFKGNGIEGRMGCIENKLKFFIDYSKKIFYINNTEHSIILDLILYLL